MPNIIAHAREVVRGVLREAHKHASRSSHWPVVRREHLATHGVCAACGGVRLLQVHHIEPFHEDPALELVESNLLTLCTWRLCHIEIGHGGGYSFFNPKVLEHTRLIRAGRLLWKDAVAIAREHRQLNDGVVGS